MYKSAYVAAVNQTIFWDVMMGDLVWNDFEVFKKGLSEIREFFPMTKPM
jgi:hypothetical protein